MSSHACVFVNPSCNYFTKYIAPNHSIATHRHVISCVCVCKPILQLFYKIHSTKPAIATHRHVISCVCRGKPILQRFYKRTKHQTRYSNASPWHLMRVVCKPILQQFTNGQSIKLFDSDASPCHIMRVCVFVKSLQDSRRQLVPFFPTISTSNISTKVSTWIRIRGWHFCRNVRNGDSSKIRGELPTAGLVADSRLGLATHSDRALI
jgi:hypothetical protein